MFIFFVNKPFCILPYLFGMLVFFLISWYETKAPEILFVINFISFTGWYAFFLVRYYILGGKDLIFWNVNLSRFKGWFDFYLIVYGLAIIVANIFKDLPGIPLPFVLILCVGISWVVFCKTITAIFISQGFKYNPNIRDIKLDDIYQEFRKVALNKLIN